MAWCKGRRALAPYGLPATVSQSAMFGDFDLGFSVEKIVRILHIPLCWGGPGGLPRHFSKIRRRRKTHSRGPSGRILCLGRTSLLVRTHGTKIEHAYPLLYLAQGLACLEIGFARNPKVFHHPPTLLFRVSQEFCFL